LPVLGEIGIWSKKTEKEKKSGDKQKKQKGTKKLFVRSSRRGGGGKELPQAKKGKTEIENQQE